jgi:hypothetical protein
MAPSGENAISQGLDTPLTKTSLESCGSEAVTALAVTVIFGKLVEETVKD